MVEDLEPVKALDLPEDVTYFEIKYYMLIKKQERLKITED